MSEDTNVIKGLQVTIFGAKVRTIWEQKAKYHDGRAEHYRSKLRALKKVDEIAEEDGGGGDEDEALAAKFAGSSSSKSAEQDYRDRVKRHLNDSREALFWAEHTDGTKMYQLGKEELYRLGVLRERY